MNVKRDDQVTQTRPERVLLQMAIKDGEWAGIAIRFRTEEQFRFGALRELYAWLCRLRRETLRVQAVARGDSAPPADDRDPEPDPAPVAGSRSDPAPESSCG